MPKVTPYRTVALFHDVQMSLIQDLRLNRYKSSQDSLRCNG